MKEMKTCSKNKECINTTGPNLPTTEFYPTKKTKDGLSILCKSCIEEYYRLKKSKPIITDSSEFLAQQDIHKCHVFSASISKQQCYKNRNYYKTGLDKGWITIQNPVKFKRSIYCSDICNGLNSNENVQLDEAPLI